MQRNGEAFEAWETWYWGLIPLAVMLIGTVGVWWFFWRHSVDIMADPVSADGKKEGAPQEDTAKHEDSAKKEEEEVVTDAPKGEDKEVEA